MSAAAIRRESKIDAVSVSAYEIPTTSLEADGTITWDSTTIVIVNVTSSGHTGLGYTYTSLATAVLIDHMLAGVVYGRDPFAIPQCWADMVKAVRNVGRPGIASMAISAVDTALWDLKARLMGVPVVTLLGAVRESIPVYGSGGFTSYSLSQLRQQLHGWATEGISAVKMKVGTHPEEDVARVRAACEAIGSKVGLFVDANGAYSRKQALRKAKEFADIGVTWFEEPVSSDDLDGLRLIRDSAPPGMEIAAGEYGYDAFYFRRMIEAGAVDIQQADATRCGGFTGFLQANGICEGFGIPLSAHTSPSLHGHICCHAGRARNVEYFHDHVVIEQRFFDGALRAEHGLLKPNLSSPGLGLELKRKDIERYRVYGNVDSSGAIAANRAKA